MLEELEHAKKRDAKIYAELVGYGLSSDAQHITEPDPTGRHPARAMQMAIDDARITTDQIDYINAHGTSTPLGDSAETRVIKVALGEEKARKTPISSTKGATGHCLGASGAIEAIITTLAVQRDVVPPTINQEVADPACDLDYIPNESREWKTDFALSNNFGFGGHNACLVITKVRRIEPWPSAGRPSTATARSSTGRAASAAELARIWPGEDADRLRERYHEIEPRVQLEGSLPYREVLRQALVLLAESEGLELPEGEGSALGDSLPRWPVFPEVPAALAELRGRAAGGSCRSRTPMQTSSTLR